MFQTTSQLISAWQLFTQNLKPPHCNKHIISSEMLYCTQSWSRCKRIFVSKNFSRIILKIHLKIERKRKCYANPKISKLHGSETQVPYDTGSGKLFQKRFPQEKVAVSSYCQTPKANSFPKLLITPLGRIAYKHPDTSTLALVYIFSSVLKHN